MKNLLKQALMEYKENHKDLKIADKENLDYLIKKNDKNCLCDPYLAVSFGELENRLECLEYDLEDYEGEELEEKKERCTFIREHFDEIVINLTERILSKDYIWQIYYEEMEDAIDECVELTRNDA